MDVARLLEIPNDFIRVANLGSVVVDNVWQLAIRGVRVEFSEVLRLVFVFDFGDLHEEYSLCHVGADVRETPGGYVAVDCKNHVDQQE